MWFHYLFYYSLECLKYGIFYRSVLGIEERKNKKVYIGAIIALLFFAIYLNLFSFKKNLLIPYTIFILLESILCFQLTWYKMFGIAIWSSAIIGIADGTIGMNVTLGMEAIEIYDIYIEKYVTSFISILLLLLLAFIMRKRNVDLVNRIPIIYYIVFIVIAYADGIVLGYFQEYIEKEENLYLRVILSIVLLLVGVGVLLQMGMVFLLVSSQTVYKEKDQLNQAYLQMQKQHYQYLEKRESETRKFRHDERNHLHYIRELGKERECEKLVSYIDQIWENTECFSKIVSVNNGIVDAILNWYYEMAKRKDVHLKVKGHMPIKCFIDEFDLCTIFSNLLSNAIEAAQECTSKMVKVVVRYDEKMIYIYEENYFSGERKIKNGRLYTTKKDSRHHGYGIINMQDSVKKYEGRLQQDIEGNICKTLIAIKNQNKKNEEE